MKLNAHGTHIPLPTSTRVYVPIEHQQLLPNVPVKCRPFHSSHLLNLLN